MIFQVLQVTSAEDFRDIFCGADVEYATQQDKQTIDSLFCNTDFNAIYQEILDSWNWPYISSQV